MSTYLYRALSIEHEDDAYTGEPKSWPGMPLGRMSGYLSRSSAVAAGEDSGLKYVIVRSEPVRFPVPLVVAQAQMIGELREQLAIATG